MNFETVKRYSLMGGYLTLHAFTASIAFRVALETAQIARKHFSGLNFSQANWTCALSCIGGTVTTLFLVDYAFYILNLSLYARRSSDLQIPSLFSYNWRVFPFALRR